MNVHTLQVRRVAIAYLFPAAVRLDRKDNLAFYDEVTKDGVELPELQQLPRELVLLNRRPPEYAAEVRVGTLEVPVQAGQAASVAPFRLLVAEAGSPKPVKFFSDMADTCYSAFRRVWGGRLNRMQMVEVSLQATLAIDDGKGAGAFIRNRFMRGDELVRNHLARDYEQAGIKLGSGMTVVVGPNAPKPPLASAQIDLSLETVPQDQRLLLLTVMAKWHGVQIRLSDLKMPDSVRATLGSEVVDLNAGVKEPHEYVTQVYDYTTDNVLAFLAAVDR